MQAQVALPVGDEEEDLDRLSQAARFVTHLQLQLAELDRREQQLNEQVAAFHAQQVLARRAAISAQQKAEQERSDLLARAEQVTESEETLRQRVLILREQEEEFAARFEKFLEEKDAFRQQMLQEKQELEKDVQLKLDELNQTRQQWRAEQDQHRARLLAEQEQVRSEIAKSRREFQAEQDRLREAIKAEQEGALGEVEKLRTEFSAEMVRQRSELEEHRRTLHEALAEERTQWERQKEADTEEIARIRQQLQQDVAEQQRLNLQWAETRKEEKRQWQASLEEMSRSRMEGLDLRERELQQREIDLQKRFRLHEDHLERMRRELSSQRSDLEWQEQQQRIWVEQVENSIRMRLGQMRTFRNLLSQREQSLAEEQETFARHRKETEQQLQKQREQLLMERERTAEIRQEEVRTFYARQTQLEEVEVRLREEREKVSEAVAGFHELIQKVTSSSAGEDLSTLDEHLRQAMALLSQQILDLEESRRHLLELQQQQRNENVRLSGWIQSRDVWVTERETIFSKQLEELSLREQLCQQERDAWRNERIQVEQVIRNLVQQLESSQAVELQTSRISIDP